MCGLRDEVVGHEAVRWIRAASRDQALLVPVPTGDRQGRVEALIVADGAFLEYMKSKRGLHRFSSHSCSVDRGSLRRLSGAAGTVGAAATDALR